VAAVDSPLADALRDRYVLERELGRGGMATVYLALDLKHGRLVALKVLHPELAQALGPERFLREIQIASHLQHSNILPLFDSGTADGLPYYVMPYVEGESLRARMTRERQLGLEDALRITHEVAAALGHAHARGIIHRDIKPENVLLTRDGQALVADFGIARALDAAGGEKLTETGLALGTPAYMSPEQATGDGQPDSRSDIYALGCILYEMLAGQPPFTGGTAQAILARHAVDPVPSLSTVRATVPPTVEHAITKALAKVPADRFATAGEFARGLTAGAANRQPQLVRLVLGALGLVALLAAAAVVLYNRIAPRGTSTVPAVPGVTRLAVLPFENLGDSANAYFADGIADAIRGKLTALRGLEVIARASSMAYGASDKPPEEVARELGVRYLLTGTVRWAKAKNGTSQVQVSPELVEVGDAGAPASKWQQPFDAALTDVFQVQADIAGRVAEALNLTLGAAQRQTLAAKPTASLPAYDAYLKGEAAAAQFTRIDGPSLQRAIDLYERAVALDSHFVDAWTQLARAHALYYWWVVPNPIGGLAAKQAASRAEALAPGSAAAALARGSYLALVQRDAAQALATFRTGLQAEPGNVELLVGLATQERDVGHLDSALALLRTAALLDPRSLTVVQNQAQTLLFLRRYPEALAANNRALALAPQDLRSIALACTINIAQGDLAGAKAVVRAAASKVEPVELVSYLATYCEVWALDSAQQDLVLRLRPSQFGNDRGWWGLVRTRIYHLRGDRTKARIYADSARQALEEQLLAAPQDGYRHSLLGLSLAFMGRRMEAIREGHRAAALEPFRGRVIEGPYVRHAFAETYLLLDEPEKALDQLEPVLKVPYWVSPGWLRIDPMFAPLRGNPRFERLVRGS
jgi:TolB-like protein/tetratricopeptide (TPR) repeat protein